MSKTPQLLLCEKFYSVDQKATHVPNKEIEYIHNSQNKTKKNQLTTKDI
jgi:hypothetical protein